MQLHETLAAATAQGTESYPYYLSLLAIVLSLIAIFRSSTPAPANNQPATAAPSQKTMPPQAASAAQPIPPEIVAVIAAAVATVTGDSHRIVSIKPMSTSWERAGRQSVLTSHRIR